jgi:manganese oxidase
MKSSPPLLTILLLAGSFTSLAVPAAMAQQPLPVVAANSNTRSAGTLRDNILSVRIVAQQARWHPEAEDGPFLDIEAFGEEGNGPVVPGPFIRVAARTTVEAAIRNALPDTLLIFGLSTSHTDTLRIAPGETGVTTRTFDRPGTYGYGGATIVGDARHILGTGNQLLGAIVVDGLNPPADRVFVLSIWPPVPGRFVMAINGKSWPHTERLDVDVGDSVHWRVLNGTRGRHPMHLHGFYYRIDARGSWFADTVMTGERPMVVTESVPFRGTYAMTWVAERPGNWLFHCHDALHTTWRRRYNLTGERPPRTLAMRHGANHIEQDMSGLVLAIRAHNRTDVKVAAVPSATRSIRLMVNEKAGVYGDEPAFSFVQASDASPRDSIEIPARPLIMKRGEAAAITIVNRISIPTAIHWHGIELDSYNDGVAGWSGDSISRAPLIMPGDSFVARMTPPRAGTFMFHAHVDDVRQIALGLYGALIVVPPGEQWSPATDHVFIVSQLGRGRTAITGLNGSASPAPLTLKPGRHRLRFINIAVEHDATLTLESGDTVMRWRARAKDGADLGSTRATEGPARLLIAPGETYDFEIALAAGTYQLKMHSNEDAAVTINVR